MNQISKKYILFEIDRSVFLPSSGWVSIENNIKCITYSNEEKSTSFSYGFGAWGYFSYGSSGTSILPENLQGRKKLLKVNSFFTDLGNFIQTFSLEELKLSEQTFYFDIDNQLLYVNFPSKNPEDYQYLVIGATKGYSNIEGYYGNLFYEGRIRSAPSISIRKDNQFYGVMTYDTGSIVLNNIDGAFDNFRDEDVYGSVVKVLSSTTAEYTDFKTIYSGYLDSFSISTRDLNIVMRDTRKVLEEQVVKSIFTTVANDKIEDKIIPLAWGKIKDAIAYSLDETVAASYIFKVADTSIHSIKSIDKVYVEGVSVTYTSTDLTNATFILSSSVYKPGQTVTVDFEGYQENGILIENPLQIIEEICQIVNIPYNNFYFDIEQWETIKNSGLPACNIYVGESTSAIDLINQLSNSIFGLFLLTSDGKFTYKIKDIEATTKASITVSELLTPPSLNYSSDSYLSTVNVGYARRYSESETYSYFRNSTKEDELKEKYRVSKTQYFPTQLTNRSDAEVYSNKVLTEFGGIFPEYTFDTKIYHSNIDILDIVEVELYKFTDNSYGKVKIIITGISLDYNTNRITFTGRWIEDVTAHIDLATFIKWQPGVSYLQGAVVQSDGQLWRAIVPSIDNKPVPDSEFWSEFGMLFWQNYVLYPINAIAAEDGVLYRVIRQNLNASPSSNPLDWERLNSGGSTDWKDDLSYSAEDVTFYINTFYKSLTDNNKGNIPSSSPSSWELITDYSFDNTTVKKLIVDGSDFDSEIQWNSIDATLDVTLKNGVTGQLFQEQYLYCTALEDINNGEVVQFAGSDGQNIQIIKANVGIVSPTTGWYQPETTLGVATQNIIAGQKGYITAFGRVRGLDTSLWPVGTALFLDVDDPGKMSSSYAEAGIKWVNVGVVEKQHLTDGVIFVRPTWGDSIEDVTKDPTGFDAPANVVVTYNSAARTITLTGSNWHAYWRGNKIIELESGWTSPAHPTGITVPHFLYFDGSDFVWSSSPWTFDLLQIALVVADSTGVKFCQRECHGTMNWRTHEEFHQTIGTYLIGGGDLTNYTIDSTTLKYPYVSTTSVKDEDIITINPPHTTGNNYTLAYLTGSGSITFTTGSSTIVPVLGSNPYYNLYTGGTWTQSLVLNNGYMSVWLIAIPVAADSGSQAYRYIWLQGQTSDGLAAQQASLPSSLNLGNLANLTPELVFLDKVILRYQSGNWSISEVQKLTGTRFSQSASPGGSYLSSISTDATLTGVGTSTSPLSVVSSPKLTTARTIAGKTFDGTQNVTLDTLTRGSYLTGSNYNGNGATTWTVDATSANTASKVVARDTSGNFSAGTITATLNGNSSTATLASNAIEWDGAAKIISASDPTGGADGDIWIQTSDGGGGGAGSVEWVSTYTYKDGNIVFYNSTWWESLLDNNLGVIPEEGSYWTKIDEFSVNAATATKLATSRTIQGVGFDGTANINIINGTGFVKASGTTLSYDNTTYLPSSSYTPTAAVLSGYVAASGTITSSDTIETAIEKLGFDKHVAVTLATNHGLSLSGQVIGLGTPSSITNSSTNSVTTTTHTHAVSGLTTSNLSATAGITNAQLANSSVTVGTTSISLGSSATTLAGLTSVTATTFTGALSGNATTATTLQNARTIAISGKVTGTATSFNGGSNITIATTAAAITSAEVTDKVTTIDTSAAIPTSNAVKTYVDARGFIPAYGMIYSTSTTGTGLVSSPVILNLSTSGPLSGITSNGSGSLTVATQGIYRVSVSSSVLSTATPNQTIEIRVNGVATTVKQSMAAHNTVLRAFAFSGLLDLTSNSVVAAYQWNSSSATTTYSNINLSIERIA